VFFFFFFPPSYRHQVILTSDIIGQAYELLRTLVDDVEGLDKDTICRIHARFMKTCRFSDMHYIPAGRTRTETRKNVVVSGVYVIECCPFPEVDVEVEYICKMAKVSTFVACGFVHAFIMNFDIVAVYQKVAEPICSSKLVSSGILQVPSIRSMAISLSILMLLA
jgi:hypothetical protein